MRKGALLALIFGAVAASCSPEDLAYTIPRCGEVSDAAILEAQSVPTAAKVPCVGLLPRGWSRGDFETRNGETRFVLDSDRAGLGAFEVTLSNTCDFSGSTELPTDEPETRLYARVGPIETAYSGTHFYIFSGGCVSYSFDFRGAGRTALLFQVTEALSFIDRDRIESAVAELGLPLSP